MDVACPALLRDLLDPLQDNIVFKGLHDIVYGSLIESVLCDALLPHSCDYDKIRAFFQSFVMVDGVHHTESVHFRHDQIEQDNIRLFFPYHTAHILTVVRLPHKA